MTGRWITAEQVAAMERACPDDLSRRVVTQMTREGLHRDEVARLHGLTEGAVTGLLRRLAAN